MHNEITHEIPHDKSRILRVTTRHPSLVSEVMHSNQLSSYIYQFSQIFTMLLLSLTTYVISVHDVQ